MSKVIVSNFSVSIDGYGAGPDQSLEYPLGERGEELHEWLFATKAFHQIDGKGGGVATIRQYLQARLVDEVHFAIVPVALGRGEAMFAGINLPALGYRITEHAATAAATHIVLAR